MPENKLPFFLMLAVVFFTPIAMGEIERRTGWNIFEATGFSPWVVLFVVLAITAALVVLARIKRQRSGEDDTNS